MRHFVVIVNCPYVSAYKVDFSCKDSFSTIILNTMKYFAPTLLLTAAMAAKCPDLHQFRTENVLKGINFDLFTGDWYELGY